MSWLRRGRYSVFFFFFQAEDGIRDLTVTGVQTCALPILSVCDLQPGSAGVSGVTVRVAVVVAGLVVVATMAQGQRRIRGGRAVMVDRPAVGPRIGYDFDVDRVFVGGQLNLPVGRRWGLVPSAEFFPGQNGSPFRLNADLKYHPPTAYGPFHFGAGVPLPHPSRRKD